VALAWPRMIQIMAPRCPKRMPRWPQQNPKMAPGSVDNTCCQDVDPNNDPQMAPTWHQMIQIMVPGWPKMGSIWPQHSPNMAQGNQDNKGFIVWFCGLPGRAPSVPNMAPSDPDNLHPAGINTPLGLKFAAPDKIESVFRNPPR
jgi:hypothetical protein